MQRTFILIISLWVAIIGASLGWNLYQQQQQHETMLLQTARALHSHVILTRSWNAQHGGVYVPVTKDTQPNPFLHPEGRDIKVNDQLTLTRINPAYMTRQISEIASSTKNIQIRIASLKPIRPGNTANELEAQALGQFAQGHTEVYRYFGDQERQGFFYMAQLNIEPSCLQCHEEQDYQVGELGGGISITLNDIGTQRIGPTISSHLLVGLAVLILILMLRKRLDNIIHRLLEQTVIDPLTGIPNRRRLNELLEIEYRRCERSESTLSVLICDIDYFKAYNDYYGHLAGDRCLIKVADAISRSVTRATDLAARYGGEEFVCVVADTDTKGAKELALRIQQNIRLLAIAHEKSSVNEFVTISIGYATQSHCNKTYEDLLKIADDNLYQAKAQGRNTACGTLDNGPDPACKDDV